MSGVLVLAEQVGGRLAESAGRLVSAASTLPAPIALGLLSNDIGLIVAQASFSGVSQILAVEAESEAFDSERMTDVLRLMIDEVRPRAVLMAYTIRAATVASALAESMNFGFASDVVALRQDETGELLVTRPVYGGKVHVELALSAEAPALLLLRADLWPSALSGGAPQTRILALPPRGASRIRHRNFLRPEEGVDLTRADVIFALGRGVGEQANIAAFEEIAKRMDVTLGASRPLVSAGWMAQPQQVGQTGVTVKPRLYVAFGISGAQQHLNGMQASQTIVAVNTDKDATIFDFSDVGAVADIHEVAKQMLVLLGG